MDPLFTPSTTADIARARQHSVGDLLHRTARRYPDKLAVVAGDVRMTYAEFDAAVNRAAHALADRGLAKGDRLALLSHNCLAVRRRWRSPRPSWASCSCRSTSCSAPTRSPSSSSTPAPSGMVAEDALAPDRGEGAGRRRRRTDGVRGWIAAVRGGTRRRAGRTSTPGGRDGDASAPDVLVADDDPLRLMYTSGHRVAAQGRDAVQPVADRASTSAASSTAG